MKRLAFAAIAAVAMAGTSAEMSSLAHIDPLIGTEGSGSQYGGMMPYTGVPFGSFHLVPMTRLNRVGQLSFNQADDTLVGFILTRQPSIWMGDWGEVRIPIEPAKIEKAEYTPFCGCVTAGGRTFEYTATAHAAWLRGDMRNIRLKDGYSSSRDDENLGYPLPNFKGWRCVKHVKGGLQIGVSLISLEQARRNLAAEIGGKSFEAVVAETKAAWERYFGRVEIDAPEDVKTIFYTGLFHTLLYPRQIDEQGRYYSAFDDKVHDGTMYSCYSLWDTYRAEHAWLTFVAPERVDGMMQALLEMYREGGWLPKWPNPSYTGIMIGAPAEVVLAEAYVKGFKGFDLKLAYEAVKKNATVPQAGDDACDWRDRGEFGRTPETRGGLASYMKRGYVACDLTQESVSRTQDFCLDDCAAAILADATGHADDAAYFRARSRNYTNLWNAAASAFLPRRVDGTFVPREKVKSPYYDYCEQSPETGVWAIPFDTDGLVALMGGKETAVNRLDEFFDTLFWVPERGNRSIHGNEPSHHCAYLYNRFGAPEKTQRRVREILTRAYSTDRKGFDGNEDCGQMSAWYIMSALGFYPLDPASGEYELGSPIVRGAKLRIGAPYPPATLEIRVKNYAPDRWRVARATLNGRELKDWRVRHADLVKGGILEFEMSSMQALSGARLSPVADAEVATCVNGVIVFDDRPYQMTSAAAERLAGKTFFRRTIDGGFAAEVVKGGELFVVTPTEKAGKHLSQGKTLAALGFEKLPGEPFLTFGVNKCDIADVWRKEMRPGEKLALGKWALVCGFDPAGQPQSDPADKEKEDRILAYLKGTPSETESPRDILKNKPDYVVFVPKQPRAKEKRDPAKPGDTYNDHFQVICNPSNQHLYAFWTQASREADIDQHIAFSKSVDKGVTWTPPVVLAGSPNKKNPALLASWQQPMLAKGGRLYCLWNQQTTSRGPHCGMMFGAFSDDDGETWSAPKLVPFTERMDADPADDHIPPSWCNWQRPLRLGENGKYFVGCSRHGQAPYDRKFGCKIEFWQFENIDENPLVQDIRIKYLSTNRHALSAKDLEDAGGFRASEPALEEAAPVRLPDGRLFAIMRSSVGSPVWVQSRDGGATWSAPKILKDAEGKPYLHPRSPCPMYDWKGPEAASGKYFALVHQTFDFNEPKRNAYQHRGPLYLIAGEFDPAGEQPVKFKAPKLFAPRKGGNSFYTSYCVVDGKGVLWYNDMKFYLCGRIVGPEWFE